MYSQNLKLFHGIPIGQGKKYIYGFDRKVSLKWKRLFLDSEDFIG